MHCATEPLGADQHGGVHVCMHVSSAVHMHRVSLWHGLKVLASHRLAVRRDVTPLEAPREERVDANAAVAAHADDVLLAAALVRDDDACGGEAVVAWDGRQVVDLVDTPLAHGGGWALRGVAGERFLKPK